MRKHALIKIICWMYGVFFSASTFAVEYTCPASIQAKQSAVSEGPWETTPDKSVGEYLLDNVGFYSGHPRDMVALVPDDTSTKQEQKSIWEFSKNEHIWLACFYRNTKLIATQQLPNNIKTCKVVAQLLPSGSEITGTVIKSSYKITCQ